MTMSSVLVVDDDPAIVELVQTALEDEGYEVYAAVNGEALQLAAEQHPDVILLDIMMPIMDGVEVSRRLRADPRTAAIPIIAMSAHGRLQATGSAMQANDKLAKPFKLSNLYSAVARWAPAP